MIESPTNINILQVAVYDGAQTVTIISWNPFEEKQEVIAVYKKFWNLTKFFIGTT